MAPHNFSGPLADLMSAQLCAAAGNLAIMEIEADDVPWKAGLLTQPCAISAGPFLIPTGAGWGAEIDEQAVAGHPWDGARRLWL